MTDLDALERAWRESGDGEAGGAYGNALEQEGRIAEAASVYRELIDADELSAYHALAWLEHDRGDIRAAHRNLETYLELDRDPDEFTDMVAGVLGMWKWSDDHDFGAEPLLRRGADAYPSARADLGHLLARSDRVEEAVEVFRVGVARGEVESYLPLANLLGEQGDVSEAMRLYRLGYALGDPHSAYNLYLMLEEQGVEEAREWLWRAAEGGDDKAIQWLAESATESE